MVEIVIYSFLASVVIVLCYTVFMLHRNEWVYRERMKVLHGENGFKEHQKLPSYDAMMRKFWVWNIDKFKADDRASEE